MVIVEARVDASILHFLHKVIHGRERVCRFGNGAANDEGYVGASKETFQGLCHGTRDASVRSRIFRGD